MKKIFIGNTVIISNGFNKGKIGKVVKIKKNFVYIEGTKMIKRFSKFKFMNKINIVFIKKLIPIHISNICLIK